MSSDSPTPSFYQPVGEILDLVVIVSGACEDSLIPDHDPVNPTGSAHIISVSKLGMSDYIKWKQSLHFTVPFLLFY